MLKEEQNQNNFLRSKRFFQIILLLTALTLSYVVLDQLSFLISPALWAITFYLTFRPLYRRLIEKEGWSKYLAATFSVVLLLILISIIFILAYLIITTKLLPLLQNPDLLKISLASLEANINNFFNGTILDSFSLNIASEITRLIPEIGNQIIPFLKNIGGVVFDTAITMLMFYILLINDIKIRNFLIKISPFKATRSVAIMDKFENLVRGNAVVIPLVALTQGILGFAGYFIFGINFMNSIILGFLTAIASIIPVIGTAVVYVPVALYIGVVDNNLLFGILILIWGFLIIGGGDNLIRAFFQKKISQISFWYTVIGSILGIKIFGLSGLIFGPILLILVMALWKIYYEHYGLFSNNSIKDKEISLN